MHTGQLTKERRVRPAMDDRSAGPASFVRARPFTSFSHVFLSRPVHAFGEVWPAAGVCLTKIGCIQLSMS